MERITFVFKGILVASIASLGVNATTVRQSTTPNPPTDMYVDPAAHSCIVTWEDQENSAWNLRYRLNEPIAAQHFAWDFEDGNIDGWTLIDADGDGQGWNINTHNAYAHNSNISLGSYSYSGSALNPDNWLIGPQVVLDGTLSLWAGQRSSNYPDNFAVYICVGEFTSTADFVKISDDCSPRFWAQYNFDLTEYAGQEGHFAIRHYNSYGNWALFIDDVAIDIPECEQEWIYVNNLSKMEYTIEGLELDTEYEVQVQAIGDDGTVSEWTRPDVFTTLEEEPYIPSVHILGDIDEQAWAPDAGTKMRYHPENETYTATINVLEGRTFGFSTQLDEEGLGGWSYLLPYRFGPESKGPLTLTDEYLGQSLPLSFDNYGDVRVVSAGEYDITVSLEQNYIIIEKVGEPEHGYQRGDVNHDLAVGINDVALLIDRILTGEISNVCDICADMDNNGEVNINDLAQLIDRVLTGE